MAGLPFNDAVSELVGRSLEVVEAAYAVLDPRQDGASEMGTMVLGLIRGAETHDTHDQLTRSVVAEQYLYTIESFNGGRAEDYTMPVDWAMMFAVSACGPDAGADASFAAMRAREYYGPHNPMYAGSVEQMDLHTF